MKKSRSGFTLTELLIVIAITAIISAVGFVSLGNYRGRQAVSSAVDEVSSVIRATRQRSMAQEGGGRWGIHFSNSSTNVSSYTTFRGYAFATGTVDRQYSLPSNISFSNPFTSSTYDVVFAPLTGAVSEKKVFSVVSGRGSAPVGDLAVKSNGSAVSRMESGLVGYWHLDEGTATTTYDASGKSNIGTLTNGPTWQSGSNCKAGACLSFDGINNYISIPSNSTLNPSSAITVEAWVKSATATYNTGLWGIVSNYSAYILGPSGTNSTTMCFITATPGWNYGNCATVSNTQNWHHFAGTYDSAAGTQKFYIDGALASSTAATGNIANGGALHIGHRECCAEYFNGSIDEVRIYNRALSATEIQAMYNDLK